MTNGPYKLRNETGPYTAAEGTFVIDGPGEIRIRHELVGDGLVQEAKLAEAVALDVVNATSDWAAHWRTRGPSKWKD